MTEESYPLTDRHGLAEEGLDHVKSEMTKKSLYPYNKDDERLLRILDMIGRVASLDFSLSLDTSDDNDIIDAIAIGLNMLSEELNTNVVEKSKLDEVNAKLERFADTTAHDLKSPLNAINGLVILIEMTINADSKSEIAGYLSKLKTTVEKMNGLVKGILEYSKADSESLEKQEIDLTKVFNEVIDTDQALHKVEIQIIESLPVILFNKSAIYQVVRNLISNAVKYSDKEVCKLQIRSIEIGDHYEVSVRDNGPGIAPENHQKIFTLFNRTGVAKLDDSHGIGLATIKRILEAAGERIWVESSLNEGATFVFTIKQ